MINYMEIQKVISKYYDPRDKSSELFWRLYKDPRVQEQSTWGKVEDNKDPDGLGRVKVRAPLVFADAVSPWIQMVRPWASKEYGIWTVPDIGDAVIIGFMMNDPTKPVVLGCIPTKRTHPYYEDNPENDLKYIRTRSGLEVLLCDKDGEEELVIRAKDGDMMILMNKNGLQIKNDLGDIKIKAKKITVESKEMLFKSDKDTTLKASDGTLDLKAAKALLEKAGGDVTVEGNKIKLKGTTGVTAGGKQIAKQDDPVVGVDLHDVQIPTSSGMRTIPMIPHPYIGKLKDKLSDDVKINNKAAAMKGSKSKNSPNHIPIGGVKFKKNPNNEGEVSSGTCPTVKIDGKEAAVLGSMVKTCNDPQPQETCTIVAVGASVALPIMPPGFDPEQYKRDGGFRINMRDPVAKPGQPNSLTDERSLSSPQWSTDSALVGEEVTLSVNVQSQQGLRGAVQFKIYPDGADPEVDPPVATKAVRKESGKAEAKWRYQYIPDPDNPLDAKPKFFFEAWAFGCDKVKSGNVEMGVNLQFIVLADNGERVKDISYEIEEANGNINKGETDSNGAGELNGIIPSVLVIRLKSDDLTFGNTICPGTGENSINMEFVDSNNDNNKKFTRADYSKSLFFVIKTQTPSISE